MEDYRLDERERPERHPTAAKRLTEPPRRPISSRGGELPGRKIDKHRNRRSGTATTRGQAARRS